MADPIGPKRRRRDWSALRAAMRNPTKRQVAIFAGLDPDNAGELSAAPAPLPPDPERDRLVAQALRNVDQALRPYTLVPVVPAVSPAPAPTPTGTDKRKGEVEVAVHAMLDGMPLDEVLATDVAKLAKRFRPGTKDKNALRYPRRLIAAYKKNPPKR